MVLQISAFCDITSRCPLKNRAISGISGQLPDRPGIIILFKNIGRVNFQNMGPL